MFEWLFKYPVSMWREADIGFDSAWPLLALPAVIALALALIAISLRNKPLPVGRRAVLFVLQGLIACVLLVALWQPVLQIEVAEQGENTVAWVVDTSASMLIEDVPVGRASTQDVQSRAAAAETLVQSLTSTADSPFDVALYSQGDQLQSLAEPEQFTALDQSATTDLASGLDELLGTIGTNALVAVVLVSDGSDNAGNVDAQWWQRISAAGVPVHTVGVGRLVHPTDIELTHVDIPEKAASNVQLKATLRVQHASSGAARVRVFSGRDLIAASDIELPDGVSQSVHEVMLPTGDTGIRQLRFEVSSSEAVAQDPIDLNNIQPRVLRVEDSPRRILYVEGEPRWEYKFLRRALHDHPSVEVVSLLRTSPNKFYRQGVRDGSELADGFPATREELFAYDALIIGSLEAAELNTTQQLAVRDFVSVRGGSLLMLAGRHGLADGGWGRSVVAAALPVALDARLAASTFERTRSQARLTVAGLRTPWLALGDSPTANAQAWEGLPELADGQSLGRIKAGAQVLIEREAPDANGQGRLPLLVSQRYGKGQSMVMGSSGTWRWQMGLDSTDQRHEVFWRQLATALVDPVIPRIQASDTQAVYRDTQSAPVSVMVYDEDYEPLQQANLAAQVTLPDGSVTNVMLKADTQRPGRYESTIATPLDGPYTLTAMTPLGGESPQASVAGLEHWWVRESGTAESFNNNQQREFLERVSAATGGSYLPYAQAEQLLDVLAQENAALKREQNLPLWNMPVMFLLLFLAKALEWLLRVRWKRL